MPEDVEHYAASIHLDGNRVAIGCRCGGIVLCGVTVLEDWWHRHCTEE